MLSCRIKVFADCIQKKDSHMLQLATITAQNDASILLYFMSSQML